MIGTDRQVKWAKHIREDFSIRFPNEPLPENPFAQFWIENRDAVSITELHRAAMTQVHSPCTKKYPEVMREDILPVLQNMHKFAVFDTETTGLPTGRKKIDNPEVIEMAVVTVETGEILFNSLFRPKDLEAYLNSEAREMHAFTVEEYGNAPTFPERWDDIKSILARYHLVAYNAKFDAPMLIRTAHMYGLAIPRLRCTCAMELYQAYMTTETQCREDYKLCEAAEYMGIIQEEYGMPHTALADALVARQLLLNMRDGLVG